MREETKSLVTERMARRASSLTVAVDVTGAAGPLQAARPASNVPPIAHA